MADLITPAPNYYKSGVVQSYVTPAYYATRDFFLALIKLDWGVVLTLFKILSLIISVVLIFVLWNIRNKKRALSKPVQKNTESTHAITPPAPIVTQFDTRWQSIKERVLAYNEGDWKLAVIEADQFLDEVLKSSGFPGESMGERLMLMKPDQLLSLQYVWDAHKLRNLVVHDSSFKLSHNQALAAVESFEQALRELEALS